ncbi:hypothetical protein SDRG_08482 [Saprolegnia diclina VS20]|uniref:Peptidase S1 domain-containing protein n=1 Tax=Saprolegnia diclina (strain VS20) TaxID=1156394 RepID=T0Q7E3_SAPDV|nr:hypothetical protein SDRG_08482 [Saprolegnia diclina VS20]EQC33799.1 hypothetical protein SDRG_08482 [Saprolegnia diclina VS20]|eukprot:XP_008612594.1 hypothetical protein SDRG_08482 [Saprolegnia diclina VS20]
MISITSLALLASAVVVAPQALTAPTIVLTTVRCAKYNLVPYASVGRTVSAAALTASASKSKRQVPPKFTENSLVYDFAIVELEAPSKITPVETSFENDAANSVRGWGFDAP